ncbi:MAG: type II secretion system protein [Proteobacteria bacterium]|nr:type II secretion system protein [Pseudomonadota bacterium]
MKAYRMRMAEAGFTLLELLIAMVIGGGLIYLISDVLTLIHRGAERSREVANQVLIDQRAIALVRDAIANLVPPVNADERHKIVATESRFEFASSPVDAQSQWGTINARIVIEAPVDGKIAITYEHGETQGSKQHGSPPPRVVVLKDLTRASLQYLYRTPLGLRGEPSTPGQPPELVTLTWASDKNPNLVQSTSMRPRLNAGANCQLDLQSARCR